MGLYVQTLNNLPKESNLDFYIYLLDYGWNEPLGEVLYQNFDQMSRLASENNAVVIRSSNRRHFEDEVLSWHHINGQDADKLLPAILITNRNPHEFRLNVFEDVPEPDVELKLILIPLKKFCSTTTEVVDLIQDLFKDIKQKKALSKFEIGKRTKKGERGTLADSLILEPKSGNGVLTYDDLVNFIRPKELSPVFKLNSTVLPIHFSDLGGNGFERMTYAYVNAIRNWTGLYWLGQTGADGGRDIWGEFEGETYCYQCANYKRLILSKITEDIDKLVDGGYIPDFFTVVCSSSVSANMRQAISNYALNKGILNTVTWSGAELEEKLRNDAPSVLKRFFHGEGFPEDPKESMIEDGNILQFLSECFDRPAFTTPFHNEVNIPDFEKAITDTIEVMNTGVHRLRDSTVIRKTASRHQIKDSVNKQQVTVIYHKVVNLRTEFNTLKLSGDIRHCSCGQMDCPTYMLSDKACERMDYIRQDILNEFKSVKPDFELKVGN